MELEFSYLQKLKVVELRKELEKRKLSKHGIYIYIIIINLFND